MPKKILFIVPYPLREAPSQRFRFEQYFEALKENDYTYRVQSFLNSQSWQIFFEKGQTVRKAIALAAGLAKRLMLLLIAPMYDFVFIHREAAPIGPPVFEWIIAKVFKKKIIYDFDDAIWLTDRSNEGAFLKIIKWRSKVRYICSWAYKVSCGNDYLRQFARQYNPNVIYNPTTIDSEHWHNPSLYVYTKSIDTTIVGWTGSHSTLKYLNHIETALQKLEETFANRIRLVVIADRPPVITLKNLEFRRWSYESEINDLIDFDIGIMPLPDDEWAKGKCGFKALQYMALEIPTVISPVGVNSKIIEHGKEGFLAQSSEEWFAFLSKLIENRNLREQMGKVSRNKVINHYSVLSNTSTFLSLFT